MSKKQEILQRAIKVSGHPADFYGCWEIYGEDPNCDLFGHHSQPLLMTVRGTLQEAVDFGYCLERFFTWGHGGDIKPMPFGKILDLKTKEYFS